MRWIGALVILLAWSIGPAARVGAQPTAWGSLEPGREQVGFRGMFVHDQARPWRRTRPYDARFNPDLVGRPLQINVWYPAAAGSGKRMRFGDYLRQTTPPGFAILGQLAARQSGSVTGAFPKAILPQLLAEPVVAHRMAIPKRSKYPLLLLVGGLGSDINANALLAEYLASHGFVVASLSLMGPDERQPDQSRSRESIEANVRDLEFATPQICAAVNADCSRLAVAGHSLGAVIAMLFANRNANVSAVIGLDGTYGFKGSGALLSGAMGYAPRQMRAALLDLRRAEGVQGAEIDLSPILAFRHADLTLATLPDIHHGDFTSFAILADRYQLAADPTYATTGWTRATGRRGYEEAARTVLNFLQAHLPGAPATLSAARVAAFPGATVRHITAAPPIPSPDEAVRIAGEHGLLALQSLIRSACGSEPAAACVDQQAFNSSGYGLIARDSAAALILFEIAAWAHPTSANAQDSLADGYLAANRKVDARRASLRTIELAPADPELDDRQRREIVDAARQRIAALDRE